MESRSSLALQAGGTSSTGGWEIREGRQAKDVDATSCDLDRSARVSPRQTRDKWETPLAIDAASGDSRP